MSVETISAAVGMKPADYRALAERVRLNQGRLQACPRHAFGPMPNARSELMQRYRCSLCGGEVDSHAFHWYTLGQQHVAA